METFERSSISTELPTETGLKAIEVVGSTEIQNFENCGLLSNSELANFLREMIPLSHLENCPSIEYDPYHEEFQKNPKCLAFFDILSHEIHVGPEERFRNWDQYEDPREAMLETITHEIGHNVHQNLIEQQPELAMRWTELHFEEDCVSDYATTNEYEDFAESYRVYVHDPALLRTVAPEKYEFMRTHVFGGREYWST